VKFQPDRLDLSVGWLQRPRWCNHRHL
jgi:hypothetical protein